MFAAATAFLRAVSCGPAAEVAALGRAALEGEELFDADVGLFGPPAAIAVVLEDPSSGLEVFDRMGAHARRTGKLLMAIAAELWGGFSSLLAGHLDDALGRLGRAEEGLRLYGNPGGVVHSMQALAFIEQGEVARAREVMKQATDPVGASEDARYTLIALTELALAEGRHADAVRLTERLEPLRPPGMHPVYAPWRGLRARALVGLGERAPAIALARDELALAEQTQAAWMIGRGERLLGEALGADGEPHLRRAVELLEPTTAEGELRKARAALERLAGS